MAVESSIEVQAKVARLIERARAAQRTYEHFDQAAVDEVVTAVGWVIIDGDNNRMLTEMAIRDTGIGLYDDKLRKNHRKTLGLLRDLKGAKSVGVIAEYPERGLIEIARPVGVVGAVGFDVIDGFVQVRDHAHGQDRGQVFGVPVFRRRQNSAGCISRN